jgi:hypothetical protein
MTVKERQKQTQEVIKEKKQHENNPMLRKDIILSS